MSSLLVTFLCSSWLVSLAVIIFVCGMNNIKLRVWYVLFYTLILAILHSFAMTFVSRIVSPFLCIITFSVVLSYILDIKLKYGFKSVGIWYVFAIFIECINYSIFKYIFRLDVLYITTDITSNIVALISNSILVIMTIILLKVVSKMGAWFLGNKGAKKSVPTEKK